jgi:hypothetical protein
MVIAGIEILEIVQLSVAEKNHTILEAKSASVFKWNWEGENLL